MKNVIYLQEHAAVEDKYYFNHFFCSPEREDWDKNHKTGKQFQDQNGELNYYIFAIVLFFALG